MDERLFQAVAASVAARDATGGRFDPTILPALIAAGYDRTFRNCVRAMPAIWPAGVRALRSISTAAGAGFALPAVPRSIWGESVRGCRRWQLWTRCAPMARASRCTGRPRRGHGRGWSGAGPRAVADRGRRSPHARRAAGRARNDRRRGGHVWPRSPPVRRRSIAASPDRPHHRARSDPRADQCHRDCPDHRRSGGACNGACDHAGRTGPRVSEPAPHLAALVVPPRGAPFHTACCRWSSARRGRRGRHDPRRRTSNCVAGCPFGRSGRVRSSDAVDMAWVWA